MVYKDGVNVGGRESLLGKLEKQNGGGGVERGMVPTGKSKTSSSQEAEDNAPNVNAGVPPTTKP